MEEATNFDEYRTGYISTRWNVSDNCARALQLFEIGFTISGAAKNLGVTESTVAKYHKEIAETIHPDALLTVGGAGRDGTLDVWGNRQVEDMSEVGYDEGVADAKSVDERVTPEEEIDPEFRSPELPRNKGVSIFDIPDELITIRKT